MKRRRRGSARLRAAVRTLPRHTREAMLRGIEENQIIVGAYTDGDGGVCPMLAAHRNGGRTSFPSFARAWDEFTGARRRPRPATPREIAMLRAHLEVSLLADSANREALIRPRRVDRFRVLDLRRSRSERTPDRPPAQRANRSRPPREPLQTS